MLKHKLLSIPVLIIYNIYFLHRPIHISFVVAFCDSAITKNKQQRKKSPRVMDTMLDTLIAKNILKPIHFHP